MEKWIEELRHLNGHEVGVSQWIRIDQRMIDDHAANTGDDSWIHTDPARAKLETPFGGTIAQSFLLLAHLTEMASAIDLPLEGVAYRQNYGFDRVRMVQPVPVDSNIRGRFELKKMETKGHHGLLIYFDTSIEIEGDDIAPAVVAEWLAYVRLEE